MKRNFVFSLMAIGLAALLSIPIAVVAQDEINQVVELVFSDGESKVSIVDTINSTASVSVEVNGQQYLMSVPVTIDIDSTLPLTSSLTTIASGTRVGSWGIDLKGSSESAERTEVVVPGLFGDTEESYEPVDGNKIVLVEFDATNVGAEMDSLSQFQVSGVDAAGRVFDAQDLHCPSLNPGESGGCLMVFDVQQSVDIVGLVAEITDRKELAIPR